MPRIHPAAQGEAMDLDAFECPICLSLFQGSIFQCKNGHVVCEACLLRIQGTCPSCREPVGDIRCRALENAIASKALPCSFRSYGCTQLLNHCERRDHEAFLCQHAPFECPFQGCAYSGLLLYDHIKDAHYSLDYEVSSSGRWQVMLFRDWPFRVLLDRTERRVFLLLNGGNLQSGWSLSVACLCPRSAANSLLEYKLEVGGDGELGAFSLSATGSVACMRSWAGQYPTDRFLFVPDACRTSLDSIVVKVHIHVHGVEHEYVHVHALEHGEHEHVHAQERFGSLVQCLHALLEPLNLLLVLAFVLTAMVIDVLWASRRRAHQDM